jgi:hypothetical protein
VSIGVELEELARRIDTFPNDPFLVTVGDDGRAHTVMLAVRWDGDELVMPAGRSTSANAIARPLVVLLWAPAGRGEFSLIVDGEVRGVDDDGMLRVEPTRAVLHRPASPAGGNDCATVL